MGTIPAGPFALPPVAVLATSYRAGIDPNPTDYVSPASAIAAGLDPATVYAAWAKGLAQYGTQQEAVSAGLQPTIVQQLWSMSRSSVPGPQSGYQGLELLAFAGFVLILVLGGHSRRRWEE